MQTFTITGPDGTQYDVTGPDGSTEQEALAQVQASLSPKPDTQVEPEPEEDKPWYQNVAEGARDAFGRMDWDHAKTNLQQALVFDRGAAINDLKTKVTNGTASPAEREALDGYVQESINPNLDAARAAMAGDPEKYKGKTLEQVAVDISVGKDLGDAVETGLTLATLPLGAGAGLVRNIGLNSAIGGVGTLANQATQSAMTGEDEFKSNDIAKSAGTAGVLTGLLGGAGKIANKALNGKSNKLAEVAANVDEADLPGIQRVAEYNKEVAPSSAINLNPSQVFKADTPEAKKLIEKEASVISSLGEEGRLKNNFSNQTRNAGELAESTRNQFTKDLPEEPESLLGGMGTKLRDADKAKASELYQKNMDAVETALKNARAAPGSAPISLVPEGAIKKAAYHLGEDTRMGNLNLGSHASTLKAFSSANPKNFTELDQWKKALNEQANKAYLSGDHIASKALKDVADSLKKDAYKLADDVGADVGNYYKKADDNYKVFSGNYGKGTLGEALSDPQYNSKIVDRLLKPKTGPVDITGMRRLAAHSGTPADELDLQNAVIGSILDRGIQRATVARTGDFNYGALGSELRKSMPQLEAALKGNDEALDSVKTMTKVFDAMRTADFNRGTLQSGQSAGIKAVGDLIPTIAGSGASAAIGGVGGMAAGVATQASAAALKRGAAKAADNRLAALSRWAVEHSDDISAIKRAGGGTIKKADAAKARRLATSFIEVVRGSNSGVADQSQSVLGQFQEQPQQQKPEKNGPTVDDLIKKPEPVHEPVQRAQSGRVDPVSESLYRGITAAETGGLDNPWIRTKAQDKSSNLHSSAYGPAQITYSLAQDYLNKHPNMFTDDEKDYLKAFVNQGKMFIAHSNGYSDDPNLGYGGAGYLTNDLAKSMYTSVAKKMLSDTYRRNNGDLAKTIKAWRGVDDQAYAEKVARNI